MKAYIEFGTLPRVEAERVQSTLLPNQPFASRLEFITALAALTALFWKEVKRKTTNKSKTLASVLSSAAAPERIEWYFNNMRCRHAAPSAVLSLLGAGSAPSEALHREVNTWFRNEPELHRSTLQLQLDINGIAKLMAHGAAAYRPGLRQMEQVTLLSVLTAQIAFPPSTWSAWVGELEPPSGTRQLKASLPLKAERLATSAKLRKVFRRIVSKRPAMHVIHRRAPYPIKRTVFKKKRAR